MSLLASELQKTKSGKVTGQKLQRSAKKPSVGFRANKKPACRSRAGFLIHQKPELPASAAATTVEATTASTMEAAAAISMRYAATGITACAAASITACCASRVSARYATPRVSASDSTASITTARVSVSAATVSAVSATIAVATAVTIAAPTATPTPAPAVPWADADEDAAVKPARTVITIRCAGVWVVRIVAPLTGRWTVTITGINHCRADAHADRNLCIRCGNHCKRENNEHC